ncbi:hypothetical protein CEXT_297271 [Caerostris extrusa]|uniref:Uncharacterized protein n=1 Tax=Caerostris extrusa TaxID=172846 RepID=A0AAV4MG93_CAEEX|nr:hypothetical protein CEXT_297271 [Caerostris extrusa]
MANEIATQSVLGKGLSKMSVRPDGASLMDGARSLEGPKTERRRQLPGRRIDFPATLTQKDPVGTASRQFHLRARFGDAMCPNRADRIPCARLSDEH